MSSVSRAWTIAGVAPGTATLSRMASSAGGAAHRRLDQVHELHPEVPDVDDLRDDEAEVER